VATEPQAGRILFLDGWRGLAILAVIFAHFGTTGVLNMGRFGVEMFFVLSGRLMAEILFEKGTPLSKFFPRRVSRVWPALMVMISIALLLGIAFGVGDVSWQAWLAAMTFTYNYATLFGIQSTWIEHTWSLCVEEHVYILLGTLAAATRLLKIPPIKALFVISGLMMANGLVQTLAFKLSYYEVYWRSDVRGASIVLGAGVYLATKNVRAPSSAAVLLGVLGLALNMNAVPDTVKYTIGTSLLALSVCLLPQASEPTLRALSSRAIIFVGAISYSLYLWQQPFSKLVVTEGPISSQLFVRATLLSVAVGIAWFSWRFIEAPARSYLNRLWAGVDPQRVQ